MKTMSHVDWEFVGGAGIGGNSPYLTLGEKRIRVGEIPRGEITGK